MRLTLFSMRCFSVPPPVALKIAAEGMRNGALVEVTTR